VFENEVVRIIFKLEGGSNIVEWVPCHHSLAHRQVADGGKRPSEIEVSCGYTE
jgi:hypothetical protein